MDIAQNLEDLPRVRVLVVDDDEALLRMLRLSMASQGLDVATAVDGVDGLEKLASREFDVVVLDLQMPRMDGRAFCREMLSRGYRPRVVILSAYGAHEARRELKAADAVAKPFDPDLLVDTVLRVAAPVRSPVRLRHAEEGRGGAYATED